MCAYDSRRSGLFVTVACASSRRLDAGVEASGPHDFAVRESAVRQRQPSASTASRTYVRDDRETPLCVRRDGNGYRFDLGQARREIFLQMGLDSQFTYLPVGQISWPVRYNSKAEGVTRLFIFGEPRAADGPYHIKTSR